MMADAAQLESCATSANIKQVLNLASILLHGG
jgi:hypothetical protein